MSKIKEALRKYALTADEWRERQYMLDDAMVKACWTNFRKLFDELKEGSERSYSINEHAIRKNREKMDQRRSDL